MTPSQKSKHLFSLFYMELLQADSDVSEEIVISLLAKKCAIICCDEVIEQDKVWVGSKYERKTSGQFWRDVKKELQKP